MRVSPKDLTHCQLSTGRRWKGPLESGDRNWFRKWNLPFTPLFTGQHGDLENVQGDKKQIPPNHRHHRFGAKIEVRDQDAGSNDGQQAKTQQVLHHIRCKIQDVRYVNQKFHRLPLTRLLDNNSSPTFILSVRCRLVGPRWRDRENKNVLFHNMLATFIQIIWCLDWRTELDFCTCGKVILTPLVDNFLNWKWNVRPL